VSQYGNAARITTSIRLSRTFDRDFNKTTVHNETAKTRNVSSLQTEKVELSANRKQKRDLSGARDKANLTEQLKTF